jgi:hypothetical protein
VHVITRATLFQLAARAQAPRRTGCLQRSIVKHNELIGGEFAVRVVVDTTPCSPTRTSYAMFVHEGTAPHVIAAKNAGALAFEWANGPDGPGQYFFMSVNHPGTKPNRFLTDNLPLVVA